MNLKMPLHNSTTLRLDDAFLLPSILVNKLCQALKVAQKRELYSDKGIEKKKNVLSALFLINIFLIESYKCTHYFQRISKIYRPDLGILRNSSFYHFTSISLIT